MLSALGNDMSPLLSNRFLICEPFTLAQECPDPANVSDPANYSEDPNPTQCGIEQGEYDVWRQTWGESVQSVKLITAAERESIYYQSYWLPRCQTLVPGLDLQYFDTSVNQGATAVVYILQTAVGTDSDGIWGPLTQAAVDGISDVRSVIEKFTAARQAAYRRYVSFRLYGVDWIRRASEIGQDALSMTLSTTPEGVKIWRPFRKSQRVRMHSRPTSTRR